MPLDQLALLYALADQFGGAGDVGAIHQQAVDGLRRVVAADGVALNLAGRDRFRMAASSGLSEECRAGLDGYAAWPSDAGKVGPLLVEDTASDPRVEAVRGALLEDGIRSLAGVALLHRSGLIGQILLLRHTAAPFDESAVRFTEVVAAQLALAIGRSHSDADRTELLRRFEGDRSVLESVVMQMPAGVLLADVPSGRIAMSNARARTLWGRSFQRTSEIADYTLWRGYDNAGRRLDALDWPLARSVRHGEAVRGEEIEIERPDGTRAIVRMSSGPVLDSRGRRLAAVATAEDVTGERVKESRRVFIEEATRTLSTSLEVTATVAELARLMVGPYADWCVIHQCRDGGVVDRVEAVHSRADHGELLMPFTTGSMPIDSAHPVARAIRSGRSTLVVDPGGCRTALIHEDDPPTLPAELEPAAVLIMPLMARGRGLGAVTAVRTRGGYDQRDVELLSDLAERAGLAMDNALLYEQARTADRQKASFLAVMSHEFRTPLSAILGYADILTAEVHGSLGSRQRTDVERIKASVRHLSHLVDEILSYASMEAGRERIRPAPVDAVALTAEVAALVEPIAEAAGLELRLSLVDRPVELLTDSSKLQQILINLLSNGIKYTAAGHVELALEADPPLVRFRVRDTGGGIPAAHLEDVFEPFWQIEDGDTRLVKGTGLGLAVARRLARLMGGDIHLQSEVGVGSEFVVELPVGGVATGDAP